MNIYTNTEKVKKAREGVLEFPLLNHPLDCPIRCQGGECDLQDLTEILGGDKGRFYENKRSVLDKEFGIFIKTTMNRCIHCTRCVRFAIDICGISDIGIVGRGNNMEISSYIDLFFDSELSGNVIDLCPVGALTSKPYSFLARPWELHSKVFYNTFESLIYEIRVDIRGGSILRILPKFSFNNTDEWISDETRYCFDGLKYQRLLYPTIKLNSYVIKVSRKKIFILIKEFFLLSIKRLLINGFKFLGLNSYIGSTIDYNALENLRKFVFNLGLSNINLKYNFNNNTSLLQTEYIDSIEIKTISEYTNIWIFGNNFRIYPPLLYWNLRKSFLKKKKKIYSFGFFSFSTFYIKHFSNNIFDLQNLFMGKNLLSYNLYKNTNLFFISDNFKRKYFDFNTTYLANNKVKIKWIFINTTNIQLYHLGFPNSIHNQNNSFLPISIIYILNYDFSKIKLTNKIKQLIIYQGSNADFCVKFSNIISPTTTPFEGSNQKFLNSNLKWCLIGESIITKKTTLKNDWEVLQALNYYFFPNNNNESKIIKNMRLCVSGVLNKKLFSNIIYSSMIIFNSFCGSLFENQIFIKNSFIKNSKQLQSWKKTHSNFGLKR